MLVVSEIELSTVAGLGVSIQHIIVDNNQLSLFFGQDLGREGAKKHMNNELETICLLCEKSICIYYLSVFFVDLKHQRPSRRVVSRDMIISWFSLRSFFKTVMRGFFAHILRLV